MKKILPLLCAATLFTAPYATDVHATNTPKQTTLTTIKQKLKEPTTNQQQKITLEDVIKLGMENSKTLLLLQLNLEAMKYQKLDTNFDINELGFKINSIENTINKLKKADPTADTSSLMTQIDSIDDQIEALQLALKNLDFGQIQLQLQQEETKEAIRLLISSSYTNVLLLQKQIDLAKKALASATAEVQKNQKLYDLGMGSKETLRLAKATERNAQKQVTDLEKQYQKDISKFCSDIGIPYTSNVLLEPVNYTVEPVNIPTTDTLTALVNKSFKVKKAQEDLNIAIAKREDTYREYNRYDTAGIMVSNHQLQQQDYLLKVAETTFASTKDQVKTSLEQLYYNADKIYDAYKEAVSKADDAQQDYKALEKRYKLGLVSKRNFEASTLQLNQAKLNADIAYTQYFLVQQSIKAAELGYLQ